MTAVPKKKRISALLKFLLSGRGFSLRTGKYFGEALLVGLVTGFVVTGFRWLIGFGRELMMDRFLSPSSSNLRHGSALAEMLKIDAVFDFRRWVLVFLPAVGALLGYLIIKRFTKVDHARGTDSAVRAYHREGGYISGQVIPIKSVASVLTVGAGGSGGYEGPVTLIGAACGSFIARLLNLTVKNRRILMAAGLAAGLGALFQAPFAGAIFGFEIFYSSSDVEYETVLPSFIASAVSYTVFAHFYGWQPLFSMPPDCQYENGLRLMPYFVLAFIIVYGARLYISFFRASEAGFARLKIPAFTKVMLGGFITGVIGFFFPDILGTSYNIIQASFTAGQSELFADYGPLTIAGFLAFFFMKIIATSMTVASGGSAGVFAPALVCGGTLGAAVGMFFQWVLPASFDIHPAAFALVGMAGFIASTVRIPLTAIVIVAEISGNHSLMLPAMWVCGISFWLNNGWSLYRSQPHNREASPVHFSES